MHVSIFYLLAIRDDDGIVDGDEVVPLRTGEKVECHEWP